MNKKIFEVEALKYLFQKMEKCFEVRKIFEINI